jgi:inorganic triphosphatase YgiF
VLETQTERTILDLEDAEHGWAAEMALDRVQLLGHRYQETEIEVELRRGDEAALEAARQAIEALGEVHESHGSKLSRALAHARACAC